MISRKIIKLQVIEERSAEAFQERYNSEMERLAKWSPRGTFNISPGAYSAVIEYEEELKIPETLEDEFNLEGLSYECGVCPFFQLPEDKRITKIICKETGRLCRSTSRACETLYHKIKRGEVEL